MNFNNVNPSHSAMRSHHRIVILTDGYSSAFVAKTAISLLRYRSDDIAAVIDQTAAGQTAQALLSAGGSIPVVANLAAITDVDALYIGIAPPGGKMPDEWRSIIIDALSRNLDIVSGLHDFLNEDQEYVDLAEQSGARLIDVRHNRHKSVAACHRFRSENIRVHSVGHDCSVGKMVTTLEVQRGLADAGHDAKFMATGQTGIMISGEGVPVDCVVADFVNGAAEELVKQNEQHDFLLVEGQGSISHPAFSAVTLGLLHGTAPDGLIFCYEAGRKQVKGLADINIPSPIDQMHAYTTAANLRHPCRFIGVAVNTRNLTAKEADTEIQRAEDTFGLPACDVFRNGAGKLVQACVDLREELLAQ
jgi:uncharacterized NAD-dependent epimerase/dehydratase family protein